MSIKEKMVEEMMDQFFSKMSADEKQKMMTGMMEKFLGSMTPEERSSLMENMMPQMMKFMMGNMGGKGDNKDKSGESSGPWDMCSKMMGNFTKTAEMAAYATSELRGLFEEWLTQIEEELVDKINAGMTDPEKLATEFHIGTESLHYLLARLSRKGKINISVDGQQGG